MMKPFNWKLRALCRQLTPLSKSTSRPENDIAQKEWQEAAEWGCIWWKQRRSCLNCLMYTISNTWLMVEKSGVAQQLGSWYSLVQRFYLALHLFLILPVITFQIIGRNIWMLFRRGTYISNTAAISHELKVWPVWIATAAKKRRAPAFQ